MATAEKDKEPDREQRILMASRGYQPAMYDVLFDYPYTMIIRHKVTKEPAVIKRENPKRLGM